MADSSHLLPTALSRRERQIMDAIYAVGEATAAAVLAALPDPPSYSAVRTLLRILEDKGHLKHRIDRGKYIYTPTHARGSAGKSALRGVLRTFFDNSTIKAVAALMDVADTRLSDQDFAELSQLIARSRRKGGNKK